MKGIKRRPYRMRADLVFTPLMEMIACCPKCGTAVQIDWLEKLEYPIQYSKTATPDVAAVPISIPLTCDVRDCNHSFHLRTPMFGVESCWHLYGDEAGRYIDNALTKYSDVPLHFFSLTLVFCFGPKQNYLQAQLRKLKKIAKPNVDPDSWALHAKDIWGSSATSDDFDFQSTNQKIEFFEDLCDLIRSLKNYFKFYNFSSCFHVREIAKRAEHIKFQRDQLFQLSLLTTLDIMRKMNKSVSWTFDSIADSSSGLKEEGWANEIFLGLQYTRLFTWLSAASIVDAPQFVRPGSHFLLEMADFISFITAREFARSAIGEPTEVSTARLGTGFYCAGLRNGDFQGVSSVGIPLEKLYGISPMSYRK